MSIAPVPALLSRFRRTSLGLPPFEAATVKSTFLGAFVGALATGFAQIAISAPWLYGAARADQIESFDSIEALVMALALLCGIEGLIVGGFCGALIGGSARLLPAWLATGFNVAIGARIAWDLSAGWWIDDDATRALIATSVGVVSAVVAIVVRVVVRRMVAPAGPDLPPNFVSDALLGRTVTGNVVRLVLLAASLESAGLPAVASVAAVAVGLLLIVHHRLRKSSRPA